MDGSVSCDGTFASVAQKLLRSIELKLHRLLGTRPLHGRVSLPDKPRLQFCNMFLYLASHIRTVSGYLVKIAYTPPIEPCLLHDPLMSSLTNNIRS
jgi:hypothetical protein